MRAACVQHGHACRCRCRPRTRARSTRCCGARTRSSWCMPPSSRAGRSRSRCARSWRAVAPPQCVTPSRRDRGPQGDMRNWRDVVKRVERVLLSINEAHPQMLVPVGARYDDRAWDMLASPLPEAAVSAARVLLRFLQVVLKGCRTKHLFRGTRVRRDPASAAALAARQLTRRALLCVRRRRPRPPGLAPSSRSPHASPRRPSCA